MAMCGQKFRGLLWFYVVIWDGFRNWVWNTYLVSGLEHSLFFHILGTIIPINELIFFRGVGSTTTRYRLRPVKDEKKTSVHCRFPIDSVQLVYNSNFTMVYGAELTSYYYIVPGVYKPTYTGWWYTYPSNLVSWDD